MGRDFGRQLQFGKVGESVISRWLQARGHLVFPAYEKEVGTGKGPQLFAASGDLVLPDMLAFRGERILWVEAKHKTCFTWHRLTKRWVTGIDLRHYCEYQEVAARTGLPVFLMFWHPRAVPDPRDIAHGCPPECLTGLFGRNLAVLDECENHRSDRHGPTGMVYWTAQSLHLVARPQDVMEAA